MRKLLVVLALLATVVVVDRVAVGVAQGQIADRVQASQHLPQRPSVRISGFPFLTQVVRGRYSKVTATAENVSRAGLTLAEVRVVAEGVRVDLGDLLAGHVKSVPVDQARGEVLLSYDELNDYLAQRVASPRNSAVIRVGQSGSGPELRVTGTLRVPVIDRTLSLSGNARVSINGDNVTLLPNAVTAASGVLPAFAQPSAREALTVRFKLSGLPFGVQVTSAEATKRGILFRASAQGLTLTTSG